MAFGHFGQSLKVIMYALLYVYGWTDGQVLSFVKKQAKMNKGPFRTRAVSHRDDTVSVSCLKIYQ